MKTLNEITEMLMGRPDGQIIFNDPIAIKLPHTSFKFTCYGAGASEQGVFLLDGAGQWHGPLEEHQVNAKYVIESLHERLKESVTQQKEMELH